MCLFVCLWCHCTLCLPLYAGTVRNKKETELPCDSVPDVWKPGSSRPTSRINLTIWRQVESNLSGKQHMTKLEHVELQHWLKLWGVSPALVNISTETVDHFKDKQIELFMTSVIWQYVYNILGMYSLDRGRGVLSLLCNFNPLRTDVINVPGIVQDVLLHKRFPCWCCPIIFFTFP